MSTGETTIHSRAKLTALAPDILPDECALTDAPCTIGRAATCDVVVARAAVSRVHARIQPDGAYYQLVDAGSVNGTFVNGKQIREPYLLRNQDEIGLANGQGLLRFHDLEATELSPRRLHYVKREHRFTYNDVPLDLSPNLTRLLLHLFEHVGEVCSRESCVRAIWNDPVYDPERIKLLHKEVNELREKFRAVDPELDVIKTRWGVGYYLDIGM